MPTEIELAAVAAVPEPAQVEDVPGAIVESPTILHPSDHDWIRDFVWGNETAASAATWAPGVAGYTPETTWCPCRGAVRETVTVTFDDLWADGYLEYSRTHPFVVHSKAFRISWCPDPTRPDRYTYPTFDWIDSTVGYRRGRARRRDRREREEDDILNAAMAQCGVVEVWNGAASRAEELLFSILEDSQQEMFCRDKAIIVPAASGRRYLIKLGSISNVEEIDEAGRPVLRLCVHPVGVPDADVMATQKLMIETNEEAFRAMANISDPRTGRIVQRSAG